MCSVCVCVCVCVYIAYLYVCDLSVGNQRAPRDGEEEKQESKTFLSSPLCSMPDSHLVIFSPAAVGIMCVLPLRKLRSREWHYLLIVN